jgi:hypothetical protein
MILLFINDVSIDQSHSTTNDTTKQGAEDVEAMKIVLNEEQKKLEIATTETMKMLESLEVSSAEAKKEGDQVKPSLL